MEMSSKFELHDKKEVIPMKVSSKNDYWTKNQKFL